MQATTVPLRALDADASRWRWFGLPAAARRLTRRLRASERHFRTVWLIVVSPPPGSGSPTGLITTTSWRKADGYYQGAVADVIDGRSRSTVSLIPYRTTLSGDALFAELLALDTGLDSLPAAREYVPGLGSFRRS
jgi:transposase InsO family protein